MARGSRCYQGDEIPATFAIRPICTGIFPDEWKCSKVIPLFIQGGR